MTRREQALQMLGRICLRDRQWILQQLSADARVRLIRETAAEPAGQATDGREDLPAETQLERLTARLAEVPAGQMVEVLHLEPSWLVGALLNIHRWPWARDFLAALPPPTRFEVTHAARGGARLSLPATLSALRDVAQKVVVRHGESDGRARSVPRFERVLARVRRSAKR